MGLFDWFKKKDGGVGRDSYACYWDYYKAQNPHKAQDIAKVIGINMTNLADKDAKEIIGTIERWQRNIGVPICELKNSFIDSFMEQFGESFIDDFLARLKGTEMDKEAQTFNIKKDHTITRLMIDALVEYKQEKQRKALDNRLKDKIGLSDDELKSIKDKEKELNLAPDLSQNYNKENRLFNLAKDCVRRVSDEFKPLGDVGRSEALLFFSTLIIDIGLIKNDIDLDVMEDKYKLLLCDEIICDFDSDDIFDFLNKRVAFYKQQYKKVKEESLYTPMFIYNAFYMNPGCDHPEVLRDFTESPFVLIELQAKLFELENYINMKKANI